MNFTNFFKLKKPEPNEYYNVNVQNENADIVDTQLHSLDNIMNSHVLNSQNPHGVTKEQVGLGRVDNTADANKPLSNATIAALNKKQDKLAYDVRPTQNSVNALTSGALFNAFREKMDKMQIDITPRKGSLNLVYSNGVYQFVKGLFKPFTAPHDGINGIAGLVPAPTVNDAGKILSTDGWVSTDGTGGTLPKVSNEYKGNITSTDKQTIASTEAVKTAYQASLKYMDTIASVMTHFFGLTFETVALDADDNSPRNIKKNELICINYDGGYVFAIAKRAISAGETLMVKDFDLYSLTELLQLLLNK